MKIAVYTVTKDAEQVLFRWVDSCEGANEIVVVDTGSTDDTVQIARNCGAAVHQISINPWRFDDARNAALALVPADVDVCVSLDSDEVLLPGWREALEAAWEPMTSLGMCQLIGARLADGAPGYHWQATRVHARRNTRWVYPVHEVVTAYPRMCCSIPGMSIEHLHVPGKAPRDYTDLLRLAVREQPNEPRHAHYLGRELFWRGDWAGAVRELTRHITMPESKWAEERSASMRYLSRMSARDPYPRITWARKAVAECSLLRENWLELARACRDANYWAEMYAAALTCCAIKTPAYITEEAAWGGEPERLRDQAAKAIGVQI